MSTVQPRTVLDQARDLRVALEALADALASGAADAVLAAEPALAAAVMGRNRGVPEVADPEALRDDIERASRALDRCRASGAAAAALLDATVAAMGREASYDRQGGRPAAPGLRHHDLHARV